MNHTATAVPWPGWPRSPAREPLCNGDTLSDVLANVCGWHFGVTRDASCPEVSEPLGCMGVWRLQAGAGAWDLQQTGL